MDANQPIVLLGGGKMGGALAARWHAARLAPIHVVEQDAARRAELAEYGIVTHSNIADAPAPAVLVLAIKPQQFSGVVAALKTQLPATPLLVSIMAGITHAALQQISPRAARVMPNLPAVIGESMTAGFTTDLSDADRAMVTAMFEAVGQFLWVEDEALLHAVTAISGSGPAYVFAFMEALMAAAVSQGLSTDAARLLVQQTLRGAASLAEQSAEDVATLRRNVTSPGGTTEAALAALTAGKLDALVLAAVEAAAKRSRELAK